MTDPVFRPGNENDIDQVATLLSVHMNRKVAPEKFRRLMDYQWGGEKPHIGMVAEADDGIVGFLGNVYSMRNFENTSRTFGSFTSLYVHKDWRGRDLGLRMMQTYEGRPDITYTVYDPSERVHGILEQCGFRDLDTHRLVWEQGMGEVGREVEVITDRRAIAAKLGAEQRRYLDDHAALPVHPLLCRDGEYQVFCFFLRQDRGEDGLCHELIYTDDPLALAALIDRMAAGVLATNPQSRLLVDERYLDGHACKGLRQSLSCRRMVRRANPLVQDWRIDHLYSETLLLDLKLGL